ncbi:hypothetical protein NEF87_004943 [Candidatus Lokiarchaeum ossiferum]|uniref:Acetyltransferase n=1 Tax=Candidatus Lokiarchaeum ossiferum TaxID=2951803 RepID=A0ABY6HYP2_9ARCH|nr:hypothetical protein NEF87_004943 [Candidatus Lokiarchaeum sp. B-35]
MTQSSDTEDFQPILSANYPGKKGTQLLLFLEFWLTLTLMCFINLPYYRLMVNHLWMLILLPLSIYGLFWQFMGLTTLFSTIIYKILIKIEPPKEGIFTLTSREFQYYSLRFWVCYYLLYFARAMPLPWVDMFIFPIFGSKIGHNVVLYDSWIDPEFVNIGGSSMISLNTQIFSHCIYKERFIVKQVVIEKNSIVGAGAIVAPGTYIEEGAILGANCSTAIDQKLQSYTIHIGSPANISLPIKLHNGENEVKK